MTEDALLPCTAPQVLQVPEHERLRFTMCAPRAPDTDSGLVMAVEGNMYQVTNPHLSDGRKILVKICGQTSS